MRLRTIGLISTLALGLLAVPLRADAQQPEKVYRIGYLGQTRVSNNFRKGLRELGYIEGQNIVIEGRFSKGKRELFPEFAAELVRLRVDLILAVGVYAVRAAKQATRTIPIVMGNSSVDPVKHGLVASLARPGGNITGVVDIMSNLAGKRLELLKETFPKLSRVGHFSTGGPVVTAHLKETEAAARAFGAAIHCEHGSVPVLPLRIDRLCFIIQTLPQRLEAKFFGPTLQILIV